MSLALAVGLFLFAVYLLGYRGGFHSADEVSIFAVGESLVKFGRFNADQVAWTQWVTTQREAQGFFGLDGHVYSKKGLGLSLFVAPLYWLALQIPGIGLLQTALLLNPLLTALTASFLWLYVRRLGYDRRVATVLALTYGLATIAWVYAKFLFSEPLAAFLLLVAAYFLLAYRQQGGLPYLVGAGAAVGLSVPTRANNMFVVPLYVGYLALILLDLRQGTALGKWRQAIAPAFCFLAPLGAAGLIILLYNALRSGNPLDTGYDLSIVQPAFLWGLYRQLLSPHHSLFLFSPILLLSLAGWPDFIRRHVAEAGLALGSVLVYVLVFSAWTSGEGLSWGSRFLMCVVPFLILPLAPLVERWWRWPFPAGGWLFLALALLSAAIQFLGVAVNIWVYLAYLNGLYPQELLEYTPLFYDFRYTPILGQLQQFRLQNSDVAWWQPWGFDAPSLLALLALLALSGAGLFYLLRGERGRGRSAAVVALNALAALLVVAFTLPRYYRSDLQYGPWDDGYTQALTAIARQGRPGDAIITVAQYHYHVPMNRYKGPLPLIGFAQDAPPLAPNAEPLLQDTLSRYGRLWFVTVGLGPADPSNGVERWLDEHAYKASDEWLGDARLCLYATGGEAESATPLDVGFGPAIRLRGYRLEPAREDIIRLALAWKAAEPLERDYTVFVHLLDEGGQVRAQRDGVPLGGYRPTTTWEPGELLADRYGLLLPADLPPGEYALAVGMYDSTGQRLPAYDAAGKELAGGVVILPQRVTVR
jgi:hypothetical protein